MQEIRTTADLREKAIASFLNTYLFVLEIAENKIKVIDGVFVRCEGSEPAIMGRPSWHKIKETKTGEKYITHRGRRYQFRRLYYHEGV